MITIRAAFSALAVLAILGIAQPSMAGPQPTSVTVVNTPLPVTGTVQLPSGTSVRIDNTVTDPVRVRNVNDALQPVQVTANCATDPDFGTLGCGPGTFYTVPAGKRLVIEYASMDIGCILPGQAVTLAITTTTNGVDATHFAMAPAAAGPGVTAIACNLPSASSITAVGQVVRLYADAGTFVSVAANRNSNVGQMDATISISGYLMDVPLTP
jgi:hypothetical protein